MWWIFAIFLLFLLQHSRASIVRVQPVVSEDSVKVSVQLLTQCSSYCLLIAEPVLQYAEKCQENSRAYQEKNDQLNRLQAHLNVYMDKAREMEKLLNYSNTIREVLGESHTNQTNFSSDVENIISALEIGNQRRIIKDLEKQLENRNVQIREAEYAIEKIKAECLKESITSQDVRTKQQDKTINNMKLEVEQQVTQSEASIEDIKEQSKTRSLINGSANEA
ncbi:uncharacterized protein [Drosophila pseudoobscura]|uniref:Uncharacterized protein n=1 Tax=Drosophila pseudoobscura pseudoobscura TaxID=46245 RepID=A0A6I8UZL2_DROPS|nr:uncharacterized protein LOC6901528 [Drosophila pseudoobscura]